VEMKQKWRRRP